MNEMNGKDRLRPPLPLSMLRGLATRMGDIGGLLLMIACMSGSVMMMGVRHDPTTNVAGILIVTMTIACVFARAMDSKAQIAIRRLTAPAAQTREEIELRRRFHLPGDSDAKKLRQDFKERMKRWHSDTGTGNVDMHEVVKARDRLFHLVSSRGNPASGEEILAEWSREAGTLGTLWGTLLPSRRLLDAAADAGVSLTPGWRPRTGTAAHG